MLPPLPKPSEDFQCDDCRYNWKFLEGADRDGHCFMFSERKSRCAQKQALIVASRTERGPSPIQQVVRFLSRRERLDH